MAYEYFTNNALTTLAVAVEADATDIQPVDPTSFPGQGTFRIRVGSELMMVNSVAVYDMTVTKWIVERGIEGTTAAAHNPGTTARAAAIEALNDMPKEGNAGQLVLKSETDDHETTWAEQLFYANSDNIVTIAAGTANDVSLVVKAVYCQSANLTEGTHPGGFTTAYLCLGVSLMPQVSVLRCDLTMTLGCICQHHITVSETGPFDFNYYYQNASTGKVFWNIYMNYTIGSTFGIITTPFSNVSVSIGNDLPSYTSLAIRSAFAQLANSTEWQDSSGSVLSSGNKDGFFMTRETLAPSNGDLANSELGFWFDSTNRAAKFKWKDASGTVVRGEVALS